MSLSSSVTLDVDVLVVGGGPAGLSAAIVLGRSRRSVLVVDAGEPRNAGADAMHAFLTRDGIAPDEFLELGRDEAARYGVHHRDGRVIAAHRADGGFLVTLQDDEVVRARRLIVTTGLVDELPPIHGLADRWGRDVIHCPYCHGWEVRDRTIGVLATSPFALHQVDQFSQLTDHVVLLTHRGPTLDDDAAASLAARGVVVIDGEVAEVVAQDDALVGVRLDDGQHIALQALAVAPRFDVRSQLLDSLGIPTVDHFSGAGVHVSADPTGATDVPGVWVAGNVVDPMAQVITAAAQGNRAAVAANTDLIAADTAPVGQRA